MYIPPPPVDFFPYFIISRLNTGRNAFFGVAPFLDRFAPFSRRALAAVRIRPEFVQIWRVQNRLRFIVCFSCAKSKLDGTNFSLVTREKRPRRERGEVLFSPTVPSAGGYGCRVFTPRPLRPWRAGRRFAASSSSQSSPLRSRRSPSASQARQRRTCGRCRFGTPAPGRAA